MAQDKVRLGMAGCGGMAGAHLNAYVELKKKGIDAFDIVAVSDPAEEKAQNFSKRAAEFQDGLTPKVYTDLAPMLEAERLDGVDTATPHYLHHTVAVTCLEAGIHVLVEKPLGVTIKAGRKMIEAAQRCGKILATAEQVRRWVGPRTVAWALNEEGLLGNPKMFFAMNTGWPGIDPENRLLERQFTWRQAKLTGGGGPVFDSGAHYADLLIYFFGLPQTIYAKVGNWTQAKWSTPEGEIKVASVEDSSIATLTFGNGVVGTWTWTGAAPGYSLSYNVYYGDRASIYAQGVYPQKPSLHQWSGEEKSAEELRHAYMRSLDDEEKEKLFPRGITEGVALEVYDFIEAIRHSRRPELDGLDGLKSQAISEAFFESMAAGQAVEYQDVLDGKIDLYQREINEHWDV